MREAALWWQKTAEAVAQQLDTDSVQGLSPEEACRRLCRYGYNRLPTPKRRALWRLFFAQFTHFLILFLLAVTLLAGLLGEGTNAIAIGSVLIINACMGFFQEYRADRAMAALQKLSSPFSSVIRSGIRYRIPSDELVPGDVVLVEAGDHLPAEGRIVQSHGLRVEEASLTGESLPVNKQADPLTIPPKSIGEHTNLLFMGTSVVQGAATVLITETGGETELGKIATLLSADSKRKGRHKKGVVLGEEKETPLQARLAEMGVHLIGICLGIVVVIGIMGLLREMGWREALLTSLSLAVAAIPEGLPAVVTIALSAGVWRLAKKQVLIRRLSAVETLGCTHVICTDKTGTLTQNKMTVTRLWVEGTFVEVSGYTPEGGLYVQGAPLLSEASQAGMLALEIGVLCNRAQLVEREEGWDVLGDPMEGALLVAARQAGIDPDSLQRQYPFLDEVPFDSERKRMSVLRQRGEGKRLYMKGAPELLLRQAHVSTSYATAFSQAHTLFAQAGYRVLAVAYKDIEPSNIGMDEEGVTLVGLVALQDPPRPGVKEALVTCKAAGVRCVMVTGDYQETAVAIAREIGLITSPNDLIMTGSDLDLISVQDLARSVKQIVVYARVSAHHKLKIIQAWKQHPLIVAMTGDGVNDALALKEADIGIAMGCSGSDVTKEVSDLLLLDDHFASLVNGIEEGRGIYRNIIKFVLFLLTSNLAEIFVIFFGVLLGWHDLTGHPFVALIPIQLLWINLITDGFPAVALGFDPVNPEIMHRPPRPASAPILSKAVITRLVLVSLLISIGTLIAAWSGLHTSGAVAHTMAFVTIVILELVEACMVRFHEGMRFFSNRWFLLSILLSLALQILVVYLPPLQSIFGTVALGWFPWGIILSLTGVIGFFQRFISLDRESVKN